MDGWTDTANTMQTLFGHILELISGGKSPTDVFLEIWKQTVITWCQVRRIWWMTHFFNPDSSKAACPVLPVSRCILGQCSSVFLFNCNTQFMK